MDIFKTMKKETKILIGILLFALVIRIIFIYSTPVRIWDETVYANLGYDLSKNPFDYSLRASGWGDYIPSGGDSFYAWPRIGFRAPLLPYILSVFYLLNTEFLTLFFMPLIGTFTIFLVYLLSKKLFDEKVGLYSAVFLALLPMHITYSTKILTDVLYTFLITLSFFLFWKGYEEKHNLSKVLFGVSLALALLSRYTTLWILPVFLLYFLIRDKSFKFLTDKYLWFAVLAFLTSLVPFFIYGTLEYNNPIGALLHGLKASGYWGGVQSGLFFLVHWFQMFSIIGILFAAGLVWIISKKEYMRREVYLLLLWSLLFLVVASIMPHKEDRFIMAIVPAVVIIAAYCLSKLNKHRMKIFVGMLVILSVFLVFQFRSAYENSYHDTNKCFLEANEYLKNVDKNSVVITDESSVVYYYTKLETRFYPNPEDYLQIIEWADKDYEGRKVYVLFGSFVGGDLEEIKKMESGIMKNSENVFECKKSEGYSSVYEVNVSPILFNK